MDALNRIVVRAGRVFVLAIFPVDDVVRPSICKIHLESLYHGIHALVVEVLDRRINNADIPHLAKTQDSDSQRLRRAIPGEYTSEIWHRRGAAGTDVMEVCFPPVPVDGDGVTALVILEAYVQRLVDVADEVCQEHQALRQVIRSLLAVAVELVRVVVDSPDDAHPLLATRIVAVPRILEVADLGGVGVVERAGPVVVPAHLVRPRAHRRQLPARRLRQQRLHRRRRLLRQVLLHAAQRGIHQNSRKERSPSSAVYNSTQLS
uniref:Uncharacterized protein n=1 Tax=Zea mays TaxID=4577 RepID=C0PAJ5_MAIZE|nr:unknown [Zea mays]